MIFLEDNSLSLRGVLEGFSKSSKKDFLDVTFSDFNQIKFHASVDSAASPLTISLASPSIKAVKEAYNVSDVLKEYLGATRLSLKNSVEPGFDLSFQVNTADLSDARIGSICKLHSKVLGVPLVRAFEASTAGLADEPFAMPIHGEDQMVIRSHPDRTMVTFSLLLQDPSEVVLGKVFLQELFDTRQKHTLQNAPVIIFGKEPPAEVAALVPARPQSSPAFFSFGTSDEQQPVL